MKGSEAPLVKHGYMIARDGSVVPKPHRPTTLGDARRLIDETFVKNDWDADTYGRYLTILGIEPKSVSTLTVEECRTILNRMEESRMVLFQN